MPVVAKREAMIKMVGDRDIIHMVDGKCAAGCGFRGTPAEGAAGGRVR